MEEISNLMVRNHYRIMELFNMFKLDSESYKPNLEIIMKSLNKFKWELEKHLFIEEKAVFTFYNPKDNEDSNMISDIIKDHKQILEMLDKIEKDLLDKKKIDSFEFEKLLVKHQNFEDRILYPKLEKGLNESQRKIIIERISEKFPE